MNGVKTKRELSPAQREELLRTLKARFEKNMRRHQAAFHIWDKTQRGVFPKGTFELTAGPLLCSLLGTPRGGAWWLSAKHAGFVPAFISDVDSVSPRTAERPLL